MSRPLLSATIRGRPGEPAIPRPPSCFTDRWPSGGPRKHANATSWTSSAAILTALRSRRSGARATLELNSRASRRAPSSPKHRDQGRLVAQPRPCPGSCPDRVRSRRLDVEHVVDRLKQQAQGLAVGGQGGQDSIRRALPAARAPSSAGRPRTAPPVLCRWISRHRGFIDLGCPNCRRGPVPAHRPCPRHQPRAPGTATRSALEPVVAPRPGSTRRPRVCRASPTSVARASP